MDINERSDLLDFDAFSAKQGVGDATKTDITTTAPRRSFSIDFSESAEKFKDTNKLKKTMDDVAKSLNESQNEVLYRIVKSFVNKMHLAPQDETGDLLEKIVYLAKSVNLEVRQLVAIVKDLARRLEEKQAWVKVIRTQVNEGIRKRRRKFSLSKENQQKLKSESKLQNLYRSQRFRNFRRKQMTNVREKQRALNTTLRNSLLFASYELEKSQLKENISELEKRLNSKNNEAGEKSKKINMLLERLQQTEAKLEEKKKYVVYLNEHLKNSLSASAGYLKAIEQKNSAVNILKVDLQKKMFEIKRSNEENKALKVKLRQIDKKLKKHSSQKNRRKFPVKKKLEKIEEQNSPRKSIEDYQKAINERDLKIAELLNDLAKFQKAEEKLEEFPDGEKVRTSFCLHYGSGTYRYEIQGEYLEKPYWKNNYGKFLFWSKEKNAFCEGRKLGKISGSWYHPGEFTFKNIRNWRYLNGNPCVHDSVTFS